MVRTKVCVRNECEYCIGEPLYLAGTFNNWCSKHLSIGRVPAKGDQIEFVLEHNPTDELELKLSRGTWQTLSASSGGKLLPPVRVNPHDESVVHLKIEAWRDRFPACTASSQVHLIDKPVYFPRLQSYKKVWVYLPKEYRFREDKSYPVLYMHDGQHLFDEATSVGRAGPVEWMVDETLDATNESVIVVGIEHSPDPHGRKKEYMVHVGPDVEDPQGWAYLQDIVETLKPYIDQHFRTLPDRLHTAMVGSSLGGLLTWYAGMKFPDCFGSVGIFSPSVWIGKDTLVAYMEDGLKGGSNADLADRPDQQYYFYVGGHEYRKNLGARPGAMLQDLEELFTQFSHRMGSLSCLDVSPEGRHSSEYWQSAFQRFFAWWKLHFYNS